MHQMTEYLSISELNNQEISVSGLHKTRWPTDLEAQNLSERGADVKMEIPVLVLTTITVVKHLELNQFSVQ